MELNAFIIIEKHTIKRRVQERENRMAGRDRSIYCGTIKNKIKLFTRRNEIVQKR